MTILGIDEVGRGPWAGPLVVGAVILPQIDSAYPVWVSELTDSKSLSESKRQRYAVQITKEAPASALGWVSAKELDELGLAAALRLATRRAVRQIQATKIPFTQIIIDGKVNFLAQTPLAQYVTVLPKADLLVKEVSAASIIAKVARDQYMHDLAKVYPNYKFERHVGYGTAYHRQALAQFGPCPEHRFSFRPLIELGFKRDVSLHPVASSSSLPNSDPINSKQLGDRAETIVAEYLVSHGHQIIERNHRTSFYEIDIISIDDSTLYFTEVKYRKTSSRGTPLEAVTPKKQQQMTFAAESYIKLHPELQANYSVALAVAAVSGSKFRLETWFALG